MADITTTKVKFKDGHTPSDKVAINGGIQSPPMDIKGRVRIMERDIGSGKKILLFDTSNLVVYRGRSWLVQRAINKSLASRSNWHNNFISWMAFGTGGTVAGTPLVPLSPELKDYGLAEHASVGAGTNYTTVDGLDYHTFDATYPKLTNDPEVDNAILDPSCTETDDIDGFIYSCDKFLLCNIQTSISASEYNGGTDPASYLDLSEAGLFISPSGSTSYSFGSGDMKMFARVCFPAIRKTANRELIISWYLYF